MGERIAFLKLEITIKDHFFGKIAVISLKKRIIEL